MMDQNKSYNNNTLQHSLEVESTGSFSWLLLSAPAAIPIFYITMDIIHVL